MRLIKIGIANLNPTVGDFEGNCAKIIEAAKQMSKEGSTVGCFSEQVIGGYPAEDFMQWSEFLEYQKRMLLRFAFQTTGPNYSGTVFVIGLAVEYNGLPYNVAAVVKGGEILGLVPKEHLPEYGVFYEGRVFSRGIPGFVGEIDIGGEKVPFGDLIFKFPFGILGTLVCEDLWRPGGALERRAYSGAELIVVPNGSPFRSGIVETRRELVSTRAADYEVSLVYVNQLGGNDALVFDGGGYVNQNGKMAAEFKRWKEGAGVQTAIVDLDRTERMRRENTTWRTDRERWMRDNKPVRVIESVDGPMHNHKLKYPFPRNRNFFIPDDAAERKKYFNDLIEAMVTGLDYFDKGGCFRGIGISLSGGKDSALTLLLAYEYAWRRANTLGIGVSESERKEFLKSFIFCFSQPSRFNKESRSLAKELAETLGVSFAEISIEEACGREREALLSMLPLETEVKQEHVVFQNIQARIRGSRMWNISNVLSLLWLQTGNMSEKSVGFTTVGGDMMGGYSLIINLPKTVVVGLLEHMATDRYKGDTEMSEVIKKIIGSATSHELTENATSEADLFPFPVLDACLYLLVAEKMTRSEVYKVIADMFPEYGLRLLGEWVDKFIRLFSQSIYKWVQGPQGVHLGSLELDRERALQLPVIHSREWMR